MCEVCIFRGLGVQHTEMLSGTWRLGLVGLCRSHMASGSRVCLVCSGVWVDVEEGKHTTYPQKTLVPSVVLFTDDWCVWL